MNPSKDLLILGWGNPGRGDDGLGPAFVEAIEELDLPGVDSDSDYQLQVENAATIAEYRRVLFVDADRTCAEPFWMGRLEPQASGLSFSTHSVAPAAILALVRDLFQAEPEAWILGIRGYDFDEFRELLSDRARTHMVQALEYVKSTVRGAGLLETPASAVSNPIMNDHEGDPCLTTNQ